MEHAVAELRVARIPRKRRRRYGIFKKSNNMEVRLSDKVFRYVVLGIIGGKFSSAERITEDGLAKRVRVSPAPVREAMQKLEQQGWIERIPHTGTYIKQADNKHIKDICQMREMLEISAVPIVAEHITTEQLEEFEIALEKLESVQQADDYEAIRMVDANFHRLLVHFVGNERLEAIFEPVILQVSCFIMIDNNVFASFTTDLLEQYELSNHRRIYEAIAAHDVELAVQTVQTHIRIAYEVVMKLRGALGL